MRDTTAAAERVRLAAIRLALSGLRARHPQRTDLELIELLLGTRLGLPAARRSGP